jgi:hypothetical protein
MNSRRIVPCVTTPRSALPSQVRLETRFGLLATSEDYRRQEVTDAMSGGCRGITVMIVPSLSLGVACRNESPMTQETKARSSGATICVAVEAVSNSRNAAWYGLNHHNQE